jgi:glycine/D-amino acid oxidase-like deaminating enzyme
MNRRWLFVLIPIGITAFAAIGGEVVMHLWNWLAPSLFGWHLISFWQAIGLLALSRILFGGFGGRGFRRGSFRRRMEERWERMTPEEREKLRQGMGSRCGGFRTPRTQNTEPA